MNFFGNDGVTALTVAKIEAEVMTDMFNKMTATCAKKCVVKYSDGDLNVAEMLCVDRCVGKYMQAQETVGNTLRKYEEQMKALENSGVKTPNYVTPKP